ncbi:MAG: GAF domain-containing protein [Actinobacteria bacterium]|nr:GAF domain-containing protein [Actinomycetota bacterium]
MRLPHRTVQVVCESAVEATGATLGWLGVLDGGAVAIVAAAGGEPSAPAALVGRNVPRDVGSVGYVLQSGQPMAVQPAGKPGGDHGVTQLLGREPASLVCVPCASAGEPVGVLQVLDKVAGGGFSFDDVEILTLLGTVAGAALADAGAVAEDVPSPELLGRALAGLADVDPDHYARVAQIVSSLLHQV